MKCSPFENRRSKRDWIEQWIEAVEPPEAPSTPILSLFPSTSTQTNHGVSFYSLKSSTSPSDSLQTTDCRPLPRLHSPAQQTTDFYSSPRLHSPISVASIHGFPFFEPTSSIDSLSKGLPDEQPTASLYIPLDLPWFTTTSTSPRSRPWGVGGFPVPDALIGRMVKKMRLGCLRNGIMVQAS